MAKLSITIEIPNVDSTLVDPHEEASNLIDLYAEWSKANGFHDSIPELVAAEWSD